MIESTDRLRDLGINGVKKKKKRKGRKKGKKKHGCSSIIRHVSRVYRRDAPQPATSNLSAQSRGGE